MKVRDLIAVSRPANGGMDVPLVFELESIDKDIIDRYLVEHIGSLLYRMELQQSAYRLAERGIPQAIEDLVISELKRSGQAYKIRLVVHFVK